MGFIFRIVSFIGGWIAVGVLALAISAGLYIACDYAEEYSSIVKKYLQQTIYIISGIYFILILDGLPAYRCIFGMLTHASYLSLLPTFPFIQPVSIQTIGSFILTIANHLVWFHYFVSEEFRRSNIIDQGITNAGMKVLGFLFIFVWFAPIGFFVSLQSMDDCLPMMMSTGAGTGAGAGTGMSPGTSTGTGKKKGGIFKGFVDSVLSKKEQLFPGDSKRQY